MIEHQNRLIPKEWLDYQRMKEDQYFNTMPSTQGGVVFAGDSMIEYFKTGKLINTKSINRGISGYTSNQLVDNLDKLVLQYKPDILILSIGANDHYYRMEARETVNNIKKVIERVTKANKAVKIIVWALLPTDDQEDYENKYLEEINSILVDKIKEYSNVTLFDMRAEFLGDNRLGKPELYVDGVHPNSVGYSLIAKELNKLV